jgi:hypothetical protein
MTNEEVTNLLLQSRTLESFLEKLLLLSEDGNVTDWFISLEMDEVTEQLAFRVCVKLLPDLKYEDVLLTIDSDSSKPA